MLSNPPFGVEWKKIEKEIRKEAEQMGFNGRFGPGLPRVSDVDDITRLFGGFEECTRDGAPISRTFRNEDFGYRTITVERPERDADGKIVLGTKGKAKGRPVPDANLRDTENVPLGEDDETYFKRVG